MKPSQPPPQPTPCKKCKTPTRQKKGVCVICQCDAAAKPKKGRKK